ncbi:TetR/AcrR family transcriptional regulator [Kitasatospora sp. NPDC056783]|uniref:TetR/AcrR family transcriptional regulator n=1 Tax=Kitasatospora sp. NPDC056783 TaxID=3345943 RepID=UPI00369F5435
MTGSIRATDGRTLGDRAKLTRENLLTCLTGLLADKGCGDAKVVDVAKAANTSPATFYQYFPDIDSALLALGQRAVEDARAHAFTDTASAEAVAGEFFALRRKHRVVLAALDSRAARGDQRFTAIDRQFRAPVTAALAALAKERDPSAADDLIQQRVLPLVLMLSAASRDTSRSQGKATRAIAQSTTRIVGMVLATPAQLAA